MRNLFMLLSLLIGSVSANAADQPPFVNTVEIRVDELAKAKTFYGDLLGFMISEQKAANERAVYLLDDVSFVIRQVPARRKINYEVEPHTNLNLAVDSLEQFVNRLRSSGYSVFDSVPQPAQIGVFYRILDPAGNMIHLIDPNFDMGPMPKPRLFNIGIQIVDMQKAREFYVGQLGIPVLTEKYYPPVIPLKTTGAEIILHEGSKTRSTPDSESTTGISVIVSQDSESKPQVSLRATKDPDGNLMYVVQPR